jgi:hypothetical protein
MCPSPGLKPWFGYCSVHAGLKTRFPGLKSGAGTRVSFRLLVHAFVRVTAGRTADPSSSVGMTRGGVAQVGVVAGWEETADPSIWFLINYLWKAVGESSLIPTARQKRAR